MLGRQNRLAPAGSGVDCLDAIEQRLPALVVVAAVVLRTGRALQVLKVWVVAGLLGRDAAGGVVDEHHLEQVEAGVVEVGAEGGVGVAHPLGERGLEVGVAGHAGPDVLGRGAEEAAGELELAWVHGACSDTDNLPEDLEDLVNLGVAREQGLAGAHLGKDAADRPHVDAGGVLAAAEQNLRGAVPEGDDLVGVGAQGDAERAGQAEVGELEVALAVDQQVLGLEIAVQDAMAVAVAHARAQLAHELLDHTLAEPQSVQLSASALGQRLAPAALADGQGLHVLLEVEVEELEDEVQLVAVGMDNVEQAHNGRVAHLFEQGDLADGGGRHALVLGLEADLLQGHDATAIVEVAGLVDHAVRACARKRSALAQSGGRSRGACAREDD